jgi:hypothetical protein
VEGFCSSLATAFLYQSTVWSPGGREYTFFLVLIATAASPLELAVRTKVQGEGTTSAS